MEAPDKIYVNFPFGEEHPWRGPMVTKQGLNRHDTTYIRKDALLEWIDENKNYSSGPSWDLLKTHIETL